MTDNTTLNVDTAGDIIRTVDRSGTKTQVVGLAGGGSMSNLTTLISIGDCTFDVPNSRCYVPTQGVSANPLSINGWYEV